MEWMTGLMANLMAMIMTMTMLQDLPMMLQDCPQNRLRKHQKMTCASPPLTTKKKSHLLLRFVAKRRDRAAGDRRFQNRRFRVRDESRRLSAGAPTKRRAAHGDCDFRGWLGGTVVFVKTSWHENASSSRDISVIFLLNPNLVVPRLTRARGPRRPRVFVVVVEVVEVTSVRVSYIRSVRPSTSRTKVPPDPRQKRSSHLDLRNPRVGPLVFGTCPTLSPRQAAPVRNSSALPARRRRTASPLPVSQFKWDPPRVPRP